MQEKKIAVITGANRGIGKGIALKMARDGFDIATMGRSPEKKVKDNLDEIKKEGVSVLYFSGDLSSSRDRDSFCESVIERYGKIDVLVNNAGVAPKERNDILEMTEESYDYVMNINLKGTLFLTQKVANVMVETMEKRQNDTNSVTKDMMNNYRPKIINISSISAYTSSPSRGEYCISKAGISMITRLFADRLAEYGINVFEIRPGIIFTDMTEVVKDKYDRLIK
ncbi:MAG: 3-ketoacyl-ACP reductase, partial [bacterium]